MQNSNTTNIPTLYVKADSIPSAYYRALKKVHEQGLTLRTQYDRKDKYGKYIDPPGKDAKVMIEITNPFQQPRFPVLSYDERGKYIAEMLGAKDHLVVPYKELLNFVREGKEFEPTQWPYSYHQRLTAYPRSDGSSINQLEIITDKLAENPLTRRAVASTGVPEIDLFMKGDQPCLREIQLRVIENEAGQLVLNTHTSWRSRDLYKAWGDNLIGITNLIQIEIAPMIEEKTGKKVIIGPYTENNGALHIYGQDYAEKGMDTFFGQFPDEQSFIDRAWTSEEARDRLIISELQELKTESTWNFPKEKIDLIDNLIRDYESGRFTV